MQNYNPYGAVIFTSGASQSAYGFTGEAQSGDMMYLRARYYTPADGRFVSRDTWSGDANRLMTYNAWPYANGNLIYLADQIANDAGNPHNHQAVA